MPDDIKIVRNNHRPTILFYNKLHEIHRQYCPELRFGQMMLNFLSSEDPFYLEDDQFIEHFEKWAKGLKSK